jgi:hypothetical protein
MDHRRRHTSKPLDSPNLHLRGPIIFFLLSTMVGTLLLLVAAFALKLCSTVSFLSARYYAAQSYK